MPESVKYVLQVLETLEVRVGEEEGREGGEYTTRDAWFDVATVEVPLRTKIVTAMRTAAREAGLELGPEGVKARLLPADVAEPTELLPPAPKPGPRQVRL